MSEDTNRFNTKQYQEVLIQHMLSDQTSYIRAQNIIEDVYFRDNLRPVVRLIKEHAAKYSELPSPAQILANTNYETSIVPDFTDQTSKWFLDEVEKFCRHRALENIIHSGPDILAKGEGGRLETEIKEALTISLVTDLGSDFFADVRARIEARKDRSNVISTGWRTLDYKLGGGFNRGSLNVFAGGSGSGKSIFLQNIALNWALAGMNVVYISLELSETLVDERLEAMITGKPTKELLRDIEDVVWKIAKAKKGGGPLPKAGDLRVKKLPEAGTTANTIRAYLKEYQIKTGRKPDALVVDYLDLMHPNNGKIDVSNLFTKDKYVSEELRAIGSEWDIPIVSASQLNRQSIDAQEFDHSHIAGGISKINTADNVFGIFTSMRMREDGKYEIQFLKTRTAAATGQKLQLAYDFACMRITDLEPESQEDSDYDNKAQSAAATTAANNAPSQPASVAPSSGEMIRNNIFDLINANKSDADEKT